LMKSGSYGWAPTRQKPPFSSINLTLNYVRRDSISWLCFGETKPHSFS
jgi:hypothetical protein